MNRLKAFMADPSTQTGTAMTAMFLILTAGIIVNVRLAFGKPFPDGYEPWLFFLAALAGVATGGMIGKRATEKPEVIRAEGEVKAAVVAAQTTGTYPVPVTLAEVAAPLVRDSERGD